MSDDDQPHYFSPTPRTPSRPTTVPLDLPDVSLRLRADRGVFSAGRVDPGTKLLLLEAPPPAPAGDLLDLGCGYGAVALTLARRAPGATVWAVDVNERALDLTRANAAAAGVGNVRVARPAEVPATVRFATLWSNPPVRVGKAALHQLLDDWLARLATDGWALLVVQKHLGADSLHRWLAHRGWSVTRRTSRMGYRLLEVRRPGHAAGGGAGPSGTAATRAAPGDTGPGTTSPDVTTERTGPTQSAPDQRGPGSRAGSPGSAAPGTTSPDATEAVADQPPSGREPT